LIFVDFYGTPLCKENQLLKIRENPPFFLTFFPSTVKLGLIVLAPAFYLYFALQSRGKAAVPAASLRGRGQAGLPARGKAGSAPLFFPARDIFSFF
jgi:hypothetical protein